MADEPATQAMDESADAASRSADLERLLPGEDPDTIHLDDALHWMAVYRELLEIKINLLTVAREARRNTEQSAVATELGGTDLPMLERERNRFEHRLAVWTARHREIAGPRPRVPGRRSRGRSDAPGRRRPAPSPGAGRSELRPLTAGDRPRSGRQK